MAADPSEIEPANSRHHLTIRVFSCGIHLTGEHAKRNQMRSLAVFLLALCALCGCAQHYKVTLRNYQEMTTTTRPKFDKATETFRFKDDSGNQVVIPAFRVKEISPL